MFQKENFDLPYFNYLDATHLPVKLDFKIMTSQFN